MEDVMNTTHEPASLNPYAGWFFGFWLLALLVSGAIRSGFMRQDTRPQSDRTWFEQDTTAGAVWLPAWSSRDAQVSYKVPVF